MKVVLLVSYIFNYILYLLILLHVTIHKSIKLTLYEAVEADRL
jgi:hypothetical protein